MNILSSIKKALGFGPDDDLRDSDDTFTADDDIQIHTGQADTPDTPIPAPSVSAEMKAKIFEGAVAIFNSALPDFLARSVDPKAQQRLLAEAIDSAVDRYLNDLTLQAERYAEAKLRSQVEASRHDAEQLRSEMQQLEQQRTSIREQQLSADRRRRAMADRVTDLEAQVQRLEAEREQFELENKSLLNKLKVADVQPTVVEDLSKEIERLKQQLAAQGETPEKAAFEQTISDLRQQAELSQGMYNDLQQELIAERQAHQADTAELADARRLLEQVAQIQEQMSQVETVIQKRDERIDKLKATNRRLRDELAELKEQVKALESPNLFGYETAADEAESRARESIDKVAKEIAAIEDDFECPEWFVSEPEAGLTIARPADDDFGYSEPPKKPRRPESDAQLSLF